MADEVKPHEQMIRNADPVTGVKVSIGAEVHGSDGKLGEVEKVIVDARTDRITDLVVKHGFLFKTHRVVPLVHVTRQEGSTIYVDMNEETFKRAAGFAPRRYRAPDPDYVGPPGFDHQGAHQGNYQLDTIVALGAQYPGGKVFGFPGGERLANDLQQRPSLEPGSDVLDMNGEKVGKVGGLEFSADDGAVTRMTLKEGFMGTSEVELPLGWVSELSDQGVELNVSKEDVESLGE